MLQNEVHSKHISNKGQVVEKSQTAVPTSDTVFVASPTRDHEKEEAFQAIPPGWVVQFRPGTYFLGGARVTVSNVTTLVYPERTILKMRDDEYAVRDLGNENRIRASAGDNKTEADKQDSTHYKSKFIDAGGIRLQYLDFGGDGLPLIFVHSEGWDAYTYANFAPRFTDTNRVLALTRPGYGESESHPDGFGVTEQAQSLVAFLDALGIERAVFAGNSSPITYLTYLAEHHPDRVAGVIYLAGLMPMWLTKVKNSDPTGAGAMVASARARTPDPIARERSRIIDLYRPEFLKEETKTIDVPALAFANRSGWIGYERFSWPLALVGSPLMRDFYKDLPPSPATDYLRRLVDDPEFRDESLSRIQDSTARAFFTHLVNDPEKQDKIWRYQQETVREALFEGQEKFRRAFGNRLRLVALDVSVIYGYEYRDAPDLIEPHIHSFLKEIKEKEQKRLEISTNSFNDTIRSQDQDLDQKIRAHMEKLEIPGVSLAVMKEGKILLEKAYGYANLEPEVAATPSTIFPYASMAKVFTGTVVLQMVQEGQFSLEDSITQLLPNLPKAWSGVTVRQLLSNTSGLPDMHPDRTIANVRAAAKMSREEILETLINRKADFAPGESFAYNQTNYLLLGILIEKVDGRNIQDYVEEEFAKQQNLESLQYGDTSDSVPGRATWYTQFNFNSGTLQPDSTRTFSPKYPPYLYPAAGLSGTARDLASFVDGVASGRLLKDKYKREMWTAVELSDGNIFRFEDSTEGSGLGWWVNDNPEQPYVWMGGGSSGILRHYIDENLTIVVLTNLMGSEPEKIADDVAAIYLTREFKN